LPDLLQWPVMGHAACSGKLFFLPDL